MNETTNITEPIQESAQTPETTPELDSDNWDDMDFSDLTDDSAPPKEPGPQPEADHSNQPEEPKTEEQAEESKEEPPPEAESEDLYELKHYDGIRKVNRQDVIALAQKGLDYDNIRSERDASRTKYAELEGFLQELAAPNGWSIEQLMDQTRAIVLADREGIDQGVALQRVQLDRDRRALEVQQQQAQAAQQAKSQEDQRVQQSFQTFIRDYPDVDPKTIPKEVWDNFGKGFDLSGSYARWENKQLKQQLQEVQQKQATQEQNEKNKERSTGSQQTAGAGDTQNPDAIDLDWYGRD